MQTPWRLYAILTALIVFPLAYGTVHPFPVLAFQVSAYLLAGWWAIATYRKQNSWKHLHDPILLAGALALLLGLLQLLPLPMRLVAVLSPGTHDLVTLRPETGMPAPAWHSLTVVPWAAEQGLLWLAALVAWYAVIQGESQNRRSAVWIAKTMAVTGLGLALLGLFQNMTAAKAIFWAGLEREQFYATFVNPNNAAGLLIIGTLACLASSAVTQRKSKRPLWYAGALLCAVSTMVSLSRAGVVVLLFALLFTAYWTHRAAQGDAGSQRFSAVPLALIGATMLFMAWIGSTELLGEFEKVKVEGQNLNGRTEIWKITLAEMVPRFPLFGVGFGNFSEVFPVFQAHPARVHMQSAENEYVQAIAEGGLAGAALLTWVVAIVLGRIRRTLAAARRMGLGVPFSAALAALMLHMLVDFPLHVGGTALWIVACLGIVSRPPQQQSEKQASVEAASPIALTAKTLFEP